MSPAMTKNLQPEVQAALDFLHRDYAQCFEQMRYYDQQIMGIFRFMFVAYTFLTGVVTSLYQYFQGQDLDFRFPAALTLAVGLLLGIFIFGIIIRNRVYFVHMARYINEQRAWFLKFKPLGFANRSGMYTDWTRPAYFNWLSSQLWLIYITAFLNAMVLLAACWFLGTTLWLAAGLALLILAAQILAAIFALRAKEGTAAGNAHPSQPTKV